MHSVIYEQPTNELIRVCLRLETLFSRCDHTLEGEHAIDSWQCMRSLVDMLVLLDRPDLRGKLAQEISRIHSNLLPHQRSERINQDKLASILAGLQAAKHYLQAHSGKISQSLRNNEFLDNVRQHINCAGGGLSFDCPAFYFWLQQDPSTRILDLQQWLHSLVELRSFIDLYLQILRESSGQQQHTAEDGFLQLSLNPSLPCQLVRVSLEPQFRAYPEISVGKHRLSIRFYQHNVQQHRIQSDITIDFQLQCCYL